MRNNKTSLLTAIFTGAAIGVGIGILYAPYKGRKTRKNIMNAVEDTSDDIFGWLNCTKDDIAKTASKKKDEFENKIDNLTH